MKKNNKASFNKIRKYIIVSLILSICLITISCSNSSNKSNEQESQVYEKTVPEKIQEATSVQEVSKLIDGTTWHYTEDLSKSKIGGWLKVVFSNGQYITYYANPSDGKWTEGGRGVYEVSEGRYSNTGGRYYAVSWEGNMKFDWVKIPCEMTMTMDKDGCQLNVSSSFMKGINSLTMGIQEGAYYNATHSQVYTGEMSFGDYTWD